jgi:hypothetical protein
MTEKRVKKANEMDVEERSIDYMSDKILFVLRHFIVHFNRHAIRAAIGNDGSADRTEKRNKKGKETPALSDLPEDNPIEIVETKEWNSAVKERVVYLQIRYQQPDEYPT